MWVVAVYKQGVSLYWSGREWQLDRNMAHIWMNKRDAENFAAQVLGPWEACVIER